MFKVNDLIFIKSLYVVKYTVPGKFDGFRLGKFTNFDEYKTTDQQLLI